MLIRLITTSAATVGLVASGAVFVTLATAGGATMLVAKAVHNRFESGSHMDDEFFLEDIFNDF